MSVERFLLFCSFLGVLPVHPQVAFDPSSVRQLYSGGSGFYSYAPSIIERDGKEYIFTCHNHDPYLIRDDIFLTVEFQGRMIEDRSVISHSLFGWDSFHNCDPSVLETSITFNKTHYGWVMFYLGNDVDRSARNQIGIALAENIEGPWVKLAQPIIPYSDGDSWGVGQPTALPIGQSGKFLLIYSEHSHGYAGLRETTVDLHDLNHIAIDMPKVVSSSTKRGDTTVPINNIDMALDPSGQFVYAIADESPYPKTNPHYITDRLALVRMEWNSLLDGTGTWHLEAEITPPLTRLARNHNAGIVRTPQGTILPGKNLTVVFASSCADEGAKHCDERPEWTYTLWQISAKSQNAPVNK